jgi:hypothetical protein
MTEQRKRLFKEEIAEEMRKWKASLVEQGFRVDEEIEKDDDGWDSFEGFAHRQDIFLHNISIQLRDAVDTAGRDSEAGKVISTYGIRLLLKFTVIICGLNIRKKSKMTIKTIFRKKQNVFWNNTESIVFDLLVGFVAIFVMFALIGLIPAVFNIPANPDLGWNGWWIVGSIGTGISLVVGLFVFLFYKLLYLFER